MFEGRGVANFGTQSKCLSVIVYSLLLLKLLIQMEYCVEILLDCKVSYCKASVFLITNYYYHWSISLCCIADSTSQVTNGHAC